MASLKQLVLPALTLGIFSLAPIARMTRASMLAVLVVRFRAHRARERALAVHRVVTYAFRNAMLPVVTTLGMVFSFLLGANVLVEKVFAWPGIGSFAVEALIASDFAPLQGFVLTMAVMYVAAQSDHRHPLRGDRSAREDRGMSEIALPDERRAAAARKRARRRAAPCPLRAERESRSPASPSRCSC